MVPGGLTMSGRHPEKCPPHVRQVVQEYWPAKEAYDLALEAACRGHLGSQEEAEYRAAHPAPTFKQFLTEYYASRRSSFATAA